MQKLLKLVDIVWERKLDLERVLNYFSVNHKPVTCIPITNDETSSLSSSGFLPLSISVYQQLKIRYLDSPMSIKNLTIEILHPLQTQLLDGNIFFLTFEAPGVRKVVASELN